MGFCNIGAETIAMSIGSLLGLWFGQKFFNLAFCYYLHHQYFNWAAVPGGRISNSPTSQSPIVGRHKNSEMKIQDYKTLIQNLPVRQISGRTKRKTWEKFEKNRPWLRKINDKIFEGKTEVLLSRQDIFDSNGNMKELIVKTILWGYLKGMRGNHFENILSNISNLENILNELKKTKEINRNDFTTIRTQFDKIPGLGLSTYSKLLYFSQLEIDNYPCIILDYRIIDTLKRNNLEEFNSFKSISRQNGSKYYIDFLKTSNHLAQKLKTKSENIEQFVFSYGGNIK